MAWFFTSDWADQATLTAATLLRIAALTTPAMAAVMIISGGLRGAGDTLWPLTFTLIGFLLVRIPLSAYLCWDSCTIPWIGWEIRCWNLGVSGAWIAMAIDLYLRGILTVVRFIGGRWKQITMDDEAESAESRVPVDQIEIP